MRLREPLKISLKTLIVFLSISRRESWCLYCSADYWKPYLPKKKSRTLLTKGSRVSIALQIIDAWFSPDFDLSFQTERRRFVCARVMRILCIPVALRK